MKSVRIPGGFLLLQLGIVISLLLLCISITPPSTQFLNRFIIKAELDKLYALFLYLQQRAIAQNDPEILTFDSATHSYSTNASSDCLAQGVRFGFLPGVMGPPSQPTHLVTKPVTFVDSRVTFFPDGTIQSGTIYLVDDQQTTMYALTSPVSSISYLRTYHYDGSWELLA